MSPPAKEPPQATQNLAPLPSLQSILAQSGELSRTERAALIRIDQRNRWQRGERVPVEVYLLDLPDLREDVDLILDLVWNEVHLREEQGEKTRLDEYQKRFPSFTVQLERQFALHQAIQWGSLLAAAADKKADTPGVTDLESEVISVWPDDASRPPFAATLASSETPISAPAKVIIPGYEILGELGRGGMGVVYRARQIKLNRVVALKMILSGGHASQQELDRFRAEAEAVAQLQHPNIVQVYEVGEQDGHPYFSLEFIDGGSLDEKMGGQPIAPRAAAELVNHLAAAMHYAHGRGIIHRDLKPANVLLSFSGRPPGDAQDAPRPLNEGIPKITDFGLAKRLESDSGHTRTGTAVGTPSYMAPEQACGKIRAIGPATDVYALGAILYELLIGRPPFRADSVMETMQQVVSAEPAAPRLLQPRVPRDLETICLKCLEKEPRKRYASAQELADDLRRFLAGEPIHARRTPVWERGIKWAKRRPAVAALLGVCAVAALALLGLGGWYHARLQNAFDEVSRRRDEVQEQHRQAVQRMVRLNVATGMSLVDDGDLLGSLPSLVDALRLESGNAEREEMHRIRLAAVLRQCPQLAHVWFHDGQVNAAEFSLDGTRIVTAGEDHTARLWNAVTGEPICPPLPHEDAILHAALSADGSRAVTASADHTARVWNAATGQPISPSLKHKEAVHWAAFHPNGSQVVTASQDGTAQIWDAASGQQVGSPLQHAKEVHTAAFSPNGRLVVTASGDGTAQLWDATTSKAIGLPLRHQGAVYTAAFSPNGLVVGTASADHTAQVWNVATGKPVGGPLRHRDAVSHVTFSSDSRRVATASEDNTARIWDVATGERISPPLKHSSDITYVAFSPDGNRVVTASDDNTARVWDAVTGDPLSPYLKHNGTVHSAVFSPDGRRVLTANQVGTARLWELLPARPMTEAARQHMPADGHATSPDGRYTVSVDDNTAQVRQADSGKPVGAPLEHRGAIQQVAFSADSRLVVTASADRTARVWDVATGQPISPPLKHGSRVYSAAISPDGKHVATASGDNTARLWDVQTGKPLTPPLMHQGSVIRVVFHPEGRCVLTNSHDGARVWDAATGEPLTPMLPRAGWVATALESPQNAHNWELPLDQRPLEALILLAQRLSGHRVDESGALIPLDADALRAAWQPLRPRQTAKATP